MMTQGLNDREYEKFEEVGGKPAVRITDYVANSLVPSVYDYIGATYPDTTTVVYTFKTGGSGGTTVSTVTVVYTDNTKDFISSVTKS